MKYVFLSKGNIKSSKNNPIKAKHAGIERSTTTLNITCKKDKFIPNESANWYILTRIARRPTLQPLNNPRMNKTKSKAINFPLNY